MATAPLAEVVKRLSDRNHAVQLQAVRELAERAATDAGAQQTLWASLNHDSLAVASASCRAAVGLVTSGRVAYETTVEGFLTVLPSMADRATPGALDALVHLLCLRATSSPQQPVSWEIRHPLVLLLKERPSDAPVVLQSIRGRLLYSTDVDQMEQLVPMLLPFCEFFLQASTASAAACTGIYSMFRQVLRKLKSKQSVCETIVRLLASGLARIPSMSSQAAAEVCTLTQDCLEIVESLDSAPSAVLRGEILQFLLEFAIGDAGRRSIVPQLHMIKSCVEADPLVLARRRLFGVLVGILAKALDTERALLLACIECIYAAGHRVDRMSAALLLFPVVQCTSSSDGSAAASATRILAKAVDSAHWADAIDSEEHGQARPQDPDALLVPGWRYCGDTPLPDEDFVAFMAARETLEWICGDSARGVAWLQRVAAEVERGRLSSSAVIRAVLHIFAAAAAAATDSQTRLVALDGLRQLVQRGGADPLSVFTFCVYCMEREQDAVVHLQLLRALPACALDRVTAAAACNTISLVANTPAMLGTAIDLMHRLVEAYPRMFPKLLGMIVERNVTREGPWPEGALLARAAAVYKVCDTQGGQHGVDVVPAISDLVHNYSSSETAVALALAGLHRLVEDSVVSVASAWKAVGSTVEQDERPLVRVQACSLYGCFTSADDQRPVAVEQLVENRLPAGSLRAVALAKVLGALQHPDPAVLHSALQALARFHPDCLQRLPDETVAGEENKSPGDLYGPLDGVIYLGFVKRVCAHADKDEWNSDWNFGPLLKRAIANELARMGTHGVRASSKGIKRGDAGHWVARMSRRALNTLAEATLAQDRVGSSMCVLVGVDLDATKDPRPNAARTKTSIRYKRLLRDLISDCATGDVSWAVGEQLASAWGRFMARATDSLVASAASGTDVAALRDELAELIREASTASASPAAEANGIMAIAGLALAIPQHPGRSSWVEALFGALTEAVTPKSPGKERPVWGSQPVDTKPAVVRRAAVLSLAALAMGERSSLPARALEESLDDLLSVTNQEIQGVAMFAAGCYAVILADGHPELVPSALSRLIDTLEMGPADEDTVAFGARGVGLWLQAAARNQGHEACTGHLKRLMAMATTSGTQRDGAFLALSMAAAVPGAEAAWDFAPLADAVAPLATDALSTALAAAAAAGVSKHLGNVVAPGPESVLAMGRLEERFRKAGSRIAALAGLAALEGLMPDPSLGPLPAPLTSGPENRAAQWTNLLSDQPMPVAAFAGVLVGRILSLDGGPSSADDPGDYHHLPEASVLRHAFAFLQSSAMGAVDMCGAGALLVLEALHTTSTLPAVDWEPVMQGLLRRHASNGEVAEACGKFAIAQAPVSPSMAAYLSSLCSLGGFAGAPAALKLQLLEQLHVVVPYLSSTAALELLTTHVPGVARQLGLATASRGDMSLLHAGVHGLAMCANLRGQFEESVNEAVIHAAVRLFTAAAPAAFSQAPGLETSRRFALVLGFLDDSVLGSLLGPSGDRPSCHIACAAPVAVHLITTGRLALGAADSLFGRLLKGGNLSEVERAFATRNLAFALQDAMGDSVKAVLRVIVQLFDILSGLERDAPRDTVDQAFGVFSLTCVSMSTMELCASTPVNLAAHEHSLDLDTARMLMPSALVSLLQGAEVQAAKAAMVLRLNKLLGARKTHPRVRILSQVLRQLLTEGQPVARQ